MSMINELKDGERIYSQFLVTNCVKGVTTGSKSYLSITFQDASGTIEGKRWDYLPGEDELFAIGHLVAIDAEVILYKDKLQLKVYSGQLLSTEGIDYKKFVPSAPVEKEILVQKLNHYLASFQDENVSKLVNFIIKKYYDKYIEWPAAVRNHHNYVSGLLYHSITMADLGEEVCKIYPQINRDVLIGGALIHDVGKIIELSGPIATSFTLEGKLLGHISIMQAEVREDCHQLGINGEIAVVMEHMVLSHHGKMEFGSPVLPLTRESLILSMIDDMDAKMTILDKAYAETKPGETTGKLFTMDDRYFYKPTYSKE